MAGIYFEEHYSRSQPSPCSHQGHYGACWELLQRLRLRLFLLQEVDFLCTAQSRALALGTPGMVSCLEKANGVQSGCE